MVCDELMKQFSPSKGIALTLAVVLLSVAPRALAQDTPIAVQGTQVATQETPAAAANADALRKAVQNPVANLISVPIQNNSNFSVGLRPHAGCAEHPASNPLQAERGLDGDRACDPTNRLAALSRREHRRTVRPGRPEPDAAFTPIVVDKSPYHYLNTSRCKLSVSANACYQQLSNPHIQR